MTGFRFVDLLGAPIPLRMLQGAENPLLLPVGAGGVLRVLEEVTTADERERQTELLLRMRRAAAACSRCGS